MCWAMCALNDKDIEKYCKQYGMVQPYDKKRIKSASYDLSVGNEYRFSSEKEIKRLGTDGKIKIPPYSLCYLLTEESLNLPNDVCAFVFQRHGIVREGVLMYPQPPIDPGYKGKLYVLLHNLSNEDRYLKRGEHLASLVFLKLSGEAENPYGKSKDDKYMNAQTLEELKLGVKNFNPYTSALKEISETVKNWREGLLSKWIPIMLILITIFLMVLTILFGWRDFIWPFGY